MSKKLTVLAAAHSLGSFTIADLAAKAGVPTSTVQTVLNRSPQEWFDKSQLQSGAPGGQPKSYELNDEGRRAIEQMLGSVGVLPRLAPEQPATDVPLGLVSAQEALKQLATATPAAVAGLREDALGNLQWAEAEVREGAYPAYADQLLSQISRLRGELSKDFGEARTERAAEKVAQRTAEPAVAPATLASVARKQIAYWRDAMVRFIGTTPSPRPAHVFISYVGDDESSRELAGFARGCLAFARSERGTKFDLVVRGLAMETLADELTGTWPKDAAGVTEIVLCINSDVNAQAIRSAFERLETSTKLLKGAVVLDQSFSPVVQSFARNHHICYEPHASQANQLEWIEHTISGRSVQIG